MYRLESFENGQALIISDDPGSPYRANWNAESAVQGDSIAADLNRPVLLDRLAQHRFDVETSGIEVSGSRIKTDRESQGLICNAFVSLTNDLVPDVDFKAVSDWVLIDKALIKPVAKAVAAHSRGCFKGEKAVEQLIKAAATVADIEAIDIPSAFSVAYRAAYDEVMQPAGA